MDVGEAPLRSPASPDRRRGDPDRHSPRAAGLLDLLVIRSAEPIHPDSGLERGAGCRAISRLRLADGASRTSPAHRRDPSSPSLCLRCFSARRRGLASVSSKDLRNISDQLTSGDLDNPHTARQRQELAGHRRDATSSSGKWPRSIWTSAFRQVAPTSEAAGGPDPGDRGQCRYGNTEISCLGRDLGLPVSLWAAPGCGEQARADAYRRPSGAKASWRSPAPRSAPCCRA